MTWIPSRKTTDQLRIYIEGDGRAWLTKRRISNDPTPRNRLVHRLMMKDPQQDIAYIGRPCQYIMSRTCSSQTWTFERYSPQAIESINLTINAVKEQLGYNSIQLIGYSGGATIALVLAAQRTDVSSIRTIAGNLAPHFTNQYHKLTSMPKAISPIDYQKELQHIPQIHFYAIKDNTIPPEISRYYRSLFTNKVCIQRIATAGTSHHKGWEQQWEELLIIEPWCANGSKQHTPHRSTSATTQVSH